MAHQPLASLPEELFAEISKDFSLLDKLSLSSTCKQLRERLAPDVFKELRATDCPAQSQSALAAARTHGRLTETISFVGSPCPDEYGSGNSALVAPVLPNDAAALLSGTTEGILPNLRTLKIKFAFGNFEGPGEWDRHPDATVDNTYGIDVFRVNETIEYVRQVEGHRTWRALMNEAWVAVSANRTVRELVVDNFYPKWTSAFKTERYREFIGRLESLSLAFWGADNGVGWETKTMPGYVEFVHLSLGDAFLDHARSLRSLTIRASQYAALGESDMYPAPIRLSAEHMPLLESLELENYFIGGKLAAGLAGFSKTLRSVVLRDCLSAHNDGWHHEPEDLADIISWAEFFTRLSGASMEVLSRFEIVYSSSEVNPATHLDEFPGSANPPEDSAEAKRVKQILREEPGRILFGYACIDDVYGNIYGNRDQSCIEFLQGEDQRAYVGLLQKLTGQAAPKID